MAKERRSLLSRIFGSDKSNNIASASQMKLLSGYQATFTSYDGRIYDDADCRACIDAIARNGAKLNPKHIQNSNKGFKNAESNLQRLISKRPNELQNAYDFYYYVISELYTYNDTYIYILKDENFRPLALYPLHFGSYEFYETGNEIYVKFNFGGGKSRFCNIKDLIHLKRFVGKDGVTGGNSQPIIKTMSIKHVIDEGIVNAIKTTLSIRGILKSSSMLKPDDTKRIRDDFVKNFIDNYDGSGLGALDSTTNFIPIELKPITANDSQIKSIDNKILSYFGVSENIIQSKYNEDEWNAFYESVLEPIALQMSLEFTNKVFTLGEIQHGNEIIFTSNRLQYASNNTKINLLRYANNLMMVDELREVFNMEPLPDGKGQIIMQDLNHIDGNIANQYQVGNNGKIDDLDNKNDNNLKEGEKDEKQRN